jgi:hypothetical protein
MVGRYFCSVMSMVLGIFMVSARLISAVQPRITLQVGISPGQLAGRSLSQQMKTREQRDRTFNVAYLGGRRTDLEDGVTSCGDWCCFNLGMAGHIGAAWDGGGARLGDANVGFYHLVLVGWATRDRTSTVRL